MLGGSIQDYLPTVKTKIVAGCFVPELNPRAPEQVYSGAGPRIVAKAQQAAVYKLRLPIFMKRDNKAYEFVGHYSAVRFTQNETELERATAETGRTDITGVLYFEKTEA